MNCSDIDRLVSECEELDEAATSHVAQCANCRRLLHWLAAPIEVPVDESAGREAISARIRQGLRPAAALGSEGGMFAGLVAVAAVLVMLAVAVFGNAGYRELGGFERLVLGVYALAGFALFSISSASLLRPAVAPPYSPLIPWAMVGLGYPSLAWLLFPLLPAPLVWEEGLVCLVVGLCSALLSAPLIWGLARRGYVRRGAQWGAFLGALGGLQGIVVLHFICPDLDARHAVVWHGLAGALSLVSGLLLGALAGRKRIH